MQQGIVVIDTLADTRAVEDIVTLMDFSEWSSDTLTQIAEIVRKTGREIHDLAEEK
jgi:hypothetical protein